MEQPTVFRDGIFSASDPRAPYSANLTSYSDGSLGRFAIPKMLRWGSARKRLGPAVSGLGMMQAGSFRDGLFSQADPAARYQQMQSAYADGVLGADAAVPPPAPDDTAQKKKLLMMGAAGVAVLALGAALVLGKKKRR